MPELVSVTENSFSNCRRQRQARKYLRADEKLAAFLELEVTIRVGRKLS
jgi:hypothetical protein